MADGGSGVEVDVEVLRRAAALLRDAAGPLAGVTAVVGRGLDGAAAAAGHAAVASALSELASRWQTTAGAVPDRVDASGSMLRGSVEAYVAADEAGASGIGGPR